MKQPQIFVSHASADMQQAKVVRDLLIRAGAKPRLDTVDAMPGNSFVEFMERALDESDYCLLLWSRVAAKRPYVKAEWEAAFVREQNLRRAFLLVGRLEDHPLPWLLQPRLHVDLFPVPEAGIELLAQHWRHDGSVAARLRKAVVSSARFDIHEVPSPADEVYVSSQLFDRVIPVPVDLDAPAKLVLEDAVARLNLPRRLSVDDRLGINIHYRLLNEQSRPLETLRSPKDQGVTTGSVLLLEMTVEDFAATPPVSGAAPEPRTYRQTTPGSRSQPLIEALERLGLRNAAAEARKG